MKRFFCLLACLAGLFVAENKAKATFINAATTGLTNPVTTITFSEVILPDSTVLTNQYAAFGVTFQGFFYNPQPGFPIQNAEGPSVGNFEEVPALPDNTNETFSIFFNSPVTAAAFVLVSDFGNTTFTALLNNVVVETATVGTDFDDNTNIYGFINITFNQIQITTNGGNNAALLDNLQIGMAPPVAQGVPAPASLILVGMGLASALGARRFRR